MAEDGAAVELLLLRPLRAGCWQPSLLAAPLFELPEVLGELDRLLGREGAGAELVLRAPVVATLTLERLAGSLGALRALGLDEEGVREAVAGWGRAPLCAAAAAPRAPSLPQAAG